MGLKRTQDAKFVECTIEGCSFRKRNKPGANPHSCPECRMRKKKSSGHSGVAPRDGSESEPATASPACKFSSEAARGSGQAGGATFAQDQAGGSTPQHEESAHAEKEKATTVQEVTEKEPDAHLPAVLASGSGRSGVPLPAALKRQRDEGAGLVPEEEPPQRADGSSSSLRPEPGAQRRDGGGGLSSQAEPGPGVEAEGRASGGSSAAAHPASVHPGGAAEPSQEGGAAGSTVPVDSGPGAGSAAEAGHSGDAAAPVVHTGMEWDAPPAATDQAGASAEEGGAQPPAVPVLQGGGPSYFGATHFAVHVEVAPPCAAGELVQTAFPAAVSAASSGSVGSAERAATAVPASHPQMAAEAAPASSPIAGAERTVSLAAEGVSMDAAAAAAAAAEAAKAPLLVELSALRRVLQLPPTNCVCLSMNGCAVPCASQNYRKTWRRCAFIILLFLFVRACRALLAQRDEEALRRDQAKAALTAELETMRLVCRNLKLLPTPTPLLRLPMFTFHSFHVHVDIFRASSARQSEEITELKASVKQAAAEARRRCAQIVYRPQKTQSRGQVGEPDLPPISPQRAALKQEARPPPNSKRSTRPVVALALDFAQ